MRASVRASVRADGISVRTGGISVSTGGTCVRTVRLRAPTSVVWGEFASPRYFFAVDQLALVSIVFGL